MKSITNTYYDADQFGVAPGTQIGKWTVVRELGRGGMGSVYTVRSPILPGKERALKLIRADRSRSAEYQMMVSDSRYCPALLLPMDVMGPEKGAPENSLALLFKLGEKSLDAELQRRSRLPEWEALDVLYPLCSALDSLHTPDDAGQAVVHNDIKPHNLVLHDGHWRVIDLGVASRQSPSVPTRPLGFTPAYAAPELMRTRMATAASDIYAVGLVAGQCLVGMAFRGTRADLDALAARASPAAVGTITQCLSSNPAHRPTASEIHADLTGWRRPPDVDLVDWCEQRRDLILRSTNGFAGCELAEELDRVVGALDRPRRLADTLATLSRTHAALAEEFNAALRNVTSLADEGLFPRPLKRGHEPHSYLARQG